ncbi:glycerol-3-phosphate 1-O-acyltransferase PlsY [Deinococcus sp.]|uniref:glycerol-3-phosphate 1-O-acyltransferase PlsY n=1 Tax=Deinococcus sp. TaxID=47478 RepID=UPI003CC5EE40
MSTGVLIVLAVLLSYLLGALPAGSWMARQRGVDIRTVGSGNTGATNVQRTLGWGPGLIVGLFDVLKGGVAVWVARNLGLGEAVAALCGLCAVLGHNFSAFSGFRGGKGVATSFGVLLLIDPLVGMGIFPVAFATVYLTRYVSAASMVGAACAVMMLLILGRPAWEQGVVLVLAALIVYQHRANIVRLRQGSESRFGQKAAVPPAAGPKVMN